MTVAGPDSAAAAAAGRTRSGQLPSTVLICAAAQFIVLTVVAMVVYPGGAPFKKSASHYLFFGNFFSDLGATRTISGHSNLASHVMFLIALGLTGLALAYFSPAWPAIANIHGAARKTAIASQICAVISGLGFVGIAATPWNIVYDAHNAFVRLAFGLLLVYIGCVIFVQLTTGWKRPYLWLNVTYLIALAAYVVILFAGPKLSDLSGLRFQVIAQKIIVYTSILNLGAQAIGVRAIAAQARRGASN